MSAINPKIENVRVFLECVAHLAVIAAVPFFFLQQHWQETAKRKDEQQLQQSARSERAMTFIQLANDEQRTRLMSTLSAPWKRVDVERMLSKGLKAGELGSLRLSISRAVKDESIEEAVEFYTSVLLCRNQGHCDKRLIDDFFRYNIRGFACAYRERFDLLSTRLNRPDYTSLIEVYVGECPL